VSGFEVGKFYEDKWNKRVLCQMVGDKCRFVCPDTGFYIFTDKNGFDRHGIECVVLGEWKDPFDPAKVGAQIADLIMQLVREEIRKHEEGK
jgi:hypothetical protein